MQYIEKLQSTRLYFAQIYLPLHYQNRNAPIVQWIEYRIPVPTIGVRPSMGVQIK